MNRIKHLCPLLAAAVAIASLPQAAAQEKNLASLPKYQTAVPYAGIRNYHVTQNLGPTGARVWVYGHRNNTYESRELLIKSIEAGSPADGILQIHDVISGAAVPPEAAPHTWTSEPALKPFDADARLSMARAITWAESDAGKGALKLLVSRDGKTQPITIALPVMGTFSATSPFDCPKSQRIVKNAAAFLAKQMPPDGYRPDVGSPHNAGLLLASGNDAYLDHVRRSAMRMSIHHTITDAGHETWRWGNTNTFLCEYYLATGDERVLPTIRGYCQALADGQCNPGTWGHRAVPDFVPPGYGSLNSSGVVCFLSLVLGKQAGIDVADGALSNSIQFYGSYAGRGSIPYGDHPPTYASTSNGKNGAVALAFGLLGAEPAAQWFARLCASSNLPNFEGGHTGNYFNQTWSPLGAQLAGNEAYTEFWSRFHPFRDLSRRHDGSFITQPYPNTREGDLGTGYVKKGPMWSTGSYALSYLANTKRLAMLGRTDSVFAANPPAELQPALAHYRAKDFSSAIVAATAFTNTASESRLSTLASQLVDISRRNLNSIDLTLSDMARNLEYGDLVTVKWQLEGIEALLDPADPRLTSIREAVEDPAQADAFADGAYYHRATKGVSFTGLRGYESVVNTSSRYGDLVSLTKKGTPAYQAAAKHYLDAHPDPKSAEIMLFPPNRKSAEADWRHRTADDKAPKNWEQPDFRDSSWDQVAVPGQQVGGKARHLLRGEFKINDPAQLESLVLEYTMSTSLQAHLNGTLIVDINPDGGPNNNWLTPIVLKPATLELLRKGSNTLAISATTVGPGFDCTLKANLKR